MNKSTSPQITPYSQNLYSKLLTWLGWSFDKNIPDLPKFLVVGAPHTSNWDFFYFVLFIKAIRINVSFIGKDTVFWWPLGALLRKLGGIPVNRRIRTNFVDQIVAKFNQSSKLILLITPEGTRHKANYWKSGFYYIALGAQIPIILGYIDYPKKKMGLGPIFLPSGDIHEDFKIIRSFYADKTGKFPHEQGAIQLNPED
jgi:1-acyl-sn-glycerol-3-phosphate acyltransferase